ncbi:MAG TPA: hypothetical protein VIB79_27530 [Candidatus Binatia bacterium]
MDEILKFTGHVADHFKNAFGPPVLEVYRLGSLAHGGFSAVYSDIDIGVILNCAEPPGDMAEIIAGAKRLDPEYGKKLSVFWGNPDYSWGRLPVLDRVDLLDHGVPLLNGIKADFPRPSKDAIHRMLRDSLENNYMVKAVELAALKSLEAKDRKPYIRSILYPARCIYSWDLLKVNSNDAAVAYLKKVAPAGLDLRPIEMALECRQAKCSAEDVFALGTDLERQYQATLDYIDKA